MPKTLCLTPKELVLIIFEFLDFEDLTMIASTCHTFDELSWYVKKGIVALRVRRMLSDAAISVIERGNKDFKKLWLNADHLSVELCNQLSTIPNIQLKTIELRSILLQVNLQRVLPLLERFRNDIESIYVTSNTMDLTELRRKIDFIKSILLNAKVFLRIKTISTEPAREIFGLDEMNVVDLNIDYDSGAKFQSDIHNVKRLSWLKPNESICHFKNLKDLTISTDKPEIMENILNNNRTTLTKLAVHWLKEWNWTIPCQLTELNLNCEEPDHILDGQTLLRRLRLENSFITNRLLVALSRNRLLRKITFASCKLNEQLIDFRFLHYVNNVIFEESVNLSLAYEIFKRCETNTVFELCLRQISYNARPVLNDFRSRRFQRLLDEISGTGVRSTVII